MAMASVTVSVSQSGADSGSVMAGRTFTVTASGWSGSCTSATLDLSGCTTCNASESTTKSLSGSSVSWTTVTASKANSQAITVGVSGSCSSDSGTSSLFDVKNPPSLAATLSTSSLTVAKSSTAPFSLNIQNAGETTAKFGTVTASGGTGLTLSGCTPSDISGGQTLGLSCSIAASSSAAAGTVTLTISPNNADSVTKTISVTVSGGSIVEDTGGCTTCGSSGGSSSGGATASPGQEKKVTHKLAPPGLINNTKLKAAIEKVLAKGKLSQNAVDNLIKLSVAISQDTGVSRVITVNGSKTTAKTTVKYTGKKAAKNYIVYEKVPKSFANSSDQITLAVSGAKVEVVEKDPAYAIVFDTVNPNQEMSITYTVNSAVSTSAVDSFVAEVYAESLEEPKKEACARVITPAKNTATGECKEFSTPCEVPNGWVNVASCPAKSGSATPPSDKQTGEESGGKTPSAQNTRQYYLLAALVAAIALALIYFIKKR